MTCPVCRRTQEDGFTKIRCDGIETVDECPRGEVPKLSKENEGFWFLFERIYSGLLDAWGGFNYSAIDHVLDMYQIPPGQRPVILDKCLVVIGVIQKIREKEHN